MHVLVPEGLIYIRHGYYEVELTELLIHRLRDGMRFVDVGAHFGYFTLLGAHLVGNAGEVHAFEPIPRTFEILARNARRRPAVTVNPCALFSRDTPLELFDWGPRFAGYSSVAPPRLDARLAKSLNPTPLRVSAIALDHYAEAWDARPTFIKIDAESAEADVLEGMRETLRRLRPALAFEVGDFDLPDVLSSRDLIRRVEGFGYRAYSIVAGDLRPHTLKERYGPGTIVALPNRSH